MLEAKNTTINVSMEIWEKLHRLRLDWKKDKLEDVISELIKKESKK